MESWSQKALPLDLPSADRTSHYNTWLVLSLTLIQWSSSGNPVAIQCAWNLYPSVHWNATGEMPVCFQWSSNGFPVVFQCVPIMQINTGSPLGHHWVQASASVVPVASQCTCGSSGLPVCSNYANQHWIATGTPLGASISQCGSSGIPVYLWLQWSSSAICPVVSSVLTESGLEVIGSGQFPACDP